MNLKNKINKIIVSFIVASTLACNSTQINKIDIDTIIQKQDSIRTAVNLKPEEIKNYALDSVDSLDEAIENKFKINIRPYKLNIEQSSDTSTYGQNFDNNEIMLNLP